MLSRLIAFALTQRLLTVLAALSLAAGGLWALAGLPIDAFPDVSPTQVKLILKVPGMTPEEVESRVVAPLEQELLGIPSQAVLRSTAKYGIADITIDFVEGTDLYWARQQVGERFGSAAADLPPGLSGGLAPVTTPLGDVFMFTIEGPLSLTEKRTLIDWVIRPRLRVLPGVADLNALGGYVRSYEVVPDPTALSARGLGIGDLSNALRQNIGSDGAGRVVSGEESLPVRIDASVRTPEDLAAIAIRSGATAPVRVSDVASVRIGALTRYGAVTKDGSGEAAEGLVLALKGANARNVVTLLKAELADIEHTLPKGTSIKAFYDRGFLVDRAVGSVTKALLEATVLVIALLILFLGDLRSALVVTLLLPLAVLATFLAMRYLGISANLMSLGGLAIAIGLLVDAGVVVVENVLARLGAPAHGTPAPKLHVVYRAVREVASPVAGGILIICVVFLPLLTLEGLEGKLFRPVAITIVIALGASLLLSLTAVPVLASWAIRHGAHRDPLVMRWLAPRFRALLRLSLSYERRTLLIAGAGIVIAIAAVPFIGKSFLPTMDEGDVMMQLAKLPSISLEESLRIDSALERRIRAEVPEVDSVIARTGSDELGLDPMGLNETDVFLKLKPRTQWRGSKERIVGDLRRIGADFPGVDVSFTQPIEMRVAEMLTGTRGDVAVKVFGADLAAIDEMARAIKTSLSTVAGAEDVLYAPNDGVQYLEVTPERTASGTSGATAVAMQETLRALIEGTHIGIVPVDGRREPIMLRGAGLLREDPGHLLGIPVGLNNSTPLGAVATIRTTSGPVRIGRENASRFAVVQANVRGRDLVGFVAEAKERVAREVKLPSGYRLVWGGQFENQQRASARLALVVPLALGLVFFLLFTTLGSVRQASLVFANIPFALVGGILGLAVTGEYLSVPAAIGFIALMGIAVLNGLVLVEHFNELLARGTPIAEVVEQGVMRRLRPVLMTASITALGLIPVLMATGPGSEIQRPLAIVVISGLVSSTTLTLIVLPILFRRFGVVRK
jgi:heavy metal efflux system protein